MLPLLKIMVTISEEKRKKDQINIIWSLKRKEKKNKKGLSLLFFFFACLYVFTFLCVHTDVCIYPFRYKRIWESVSCPKIFCSNKGINRLIYPTLWNWSLLRYNRFNKLFFIEQSFWEILH